MVKPIGNKVLVEVIDYEHISSGGIILPESRSVDKWRRGIVRKIGKEVTELTEGDKVAYIRFKGDQYEFNGVDYQMVTEKDIALVYEGEVNFEEVLN